MNCLVHIPKNGGTSIRDIFSPPKPIWEKHACLQEVYDCVGKKAFYDSQFLAITRNPWSRLYSWWKFHKQTKQLHDYQCSFTEWMLKWCPHHWTNSPFFGGKHGHRYDAYIHAPFRQKAFVMVNGKVPKNVRVIRLERMEKEWEEVCQFFSQALPMKVSNKTASFGEYRKKYNAKTKAIASALCKQDIAWGQYDF